MYLQNTNFSSDINMFSLPSKQHFEQDYSVSLKRYLANNKLNNEYEYLTQRIAFIELIKERFTKLNIQEETEAEYSDFIDKFQGEEEKLSKWIIERVDYKKAEIKNNIDACDFYISEYNIRLSRLNQKPIKTIKQHFENTIRLYEEYCEKDEGLRNSAAPTDAFLDFNFDYEIDQNILIEEYKSKIQDTFDEEYNYLIDNYEFFWGCTFDVYLRNYDNRLIEFNQKFKDATLIDFIEDEAGKQINYKPQFAWMVYGENSIAWKNIEFSKNKKKKHLVAEANKLGYDLEFGFNHEYQTEDFHLNKNNTIQLNPPINSNLHWNGSQTDLMELIKSLIESNSIKNAKQKGMQKELTYQLSKLFNIDIKNPDKLISDLNKRNNGEETKFLNTLKTKLLEFMQAENKR